MAIDLKQIETTATPAELADRPESLAAAEARMLDRRRPPMDDWADYIAPDAAAARWDAEDEEARRDLCSEWR